jgi:hypothetical protein
MGRGTDLRADIATIFRGGRTGVKPRVADRAQI